jgi:murein DD-endopeptidase MepM/ murein hydrolase activator NlpD
MYPVLTPLPRYRERVFLATRECKAAMLSFLPQDGESFTVMLADRHYWRNQWRCFAAMFVALCTALVSSAYFQAALGPPDLGLPFANFKLSDMLDTFNSARAGKRKHEATDIIAPRGTPVLAVDDGNIVKLFWSVAGGRTIYEFDPTEHFCYYYAHLDGYDVHIREGLNVHRGQVIGYVGTTGNAPANQPHLHFGITDIGRDRKWWGGTPIDPYPILRSSALKLGIKN